MFVVSNAVDTKYFAAASDTELNEKFLSGWENAENAPVSDYLKFASEVLKIPEAHQMVMKYVVRDNEHRRLLLLRPYQIHAIEAIREASRQGKSGYIWHTTGSGKTMTSYKAARNLLMDIPSIEKTIFLIDRKDLDNQTSCAFKSYANNDVIAVDNTDNVTDLINKLKNHNQQVIVTTIQKLSIAVKSRLKEDTVTYNRIKNLRIAFVVDECHRAVTPRTQRILSQFFRNSLWYGFTGTPRFPENAYPEMGDLPRTTEQLYGKCLHAYTIKEAIQQVSTQRSALGAVQNRLEHTIANLDNVVENTTAAESQIRDTDMASEMVKYSNNNILAQAGQAMLAQANQSNQGVLSLLR
jgi:type I restriction enzyme R subunit